MSTIQMFAAESLFVGKLVRASRQSGETQPGLQVPLAADTELRFLFSPTNTQINSPLAIDAGLLQPFLEQQKEILLVTKGQDIQPALLKSLDRTSLIASFGKKRAVRLLAHLGKELVVLFPVLPQRHYVLQARLEEVYVDRVRLQYLDPRYDPRRRFPLASPIPFALIPPTIIKAVEYRQLEIMREIIPPTGNSPVGVEPTDNDGVLSDFFCQPSSSGDSSIDDYVVEELPTLLCGLQDISCGGIYLTLDGAAQPEELTHTLGLCRINLPTKPGGPTGDSALPRTLQPLCVIRAVGSTAQRISLHIRFLRRLPKEFAALFEALEVISS